MALINLGKDKKGEARFYDPNTGFVYLGTSGNAQFIIPRGLNKQQALSLPTTKKRDFSTPLAASPDTDDTADATAYNFQPTNIPGYYRDPETGELIKVSTDGGGAGPVPFSSTREAQELVAKQTQAQARLEAQLAEEAAAKARREAERVERLRVLEGLVNTLVSEQAQSRRTVAEQQGIDPLRAAGIMGGAALQGVTPAQAFRQNLAASAARPVPTIDPNASIGAINQAVRSLTGVNPPVDATGFAGGGTVPSFGPPTFGGTGYAVLTGEGGGIDGDEEVIVRRPTGEVEVIPLVGGAAAGAKFTAPSLYPSLAPLYGSLGLGAYTGQLTGKVRGSKVAFGGGGGRYLPTLGIQPTFLRNSETGEIFYNTGQGRQLVGASQLASLRKQGFQPGSIANVAPGNLGAYGPLGGSKFSGFPPATGNVRAFQPASAPLIEPNTGNLLPDPSTVARVLANLREYNPPAYLSILSAYRLAGLQPADVEAEVDAVLAIGNVGSLIGVR